ncbi:hypothetical protein B0H14DRAFT_3737194 [Mycena olivaceomarginata]|nr:hypothetical protein B0H14DRAFT_3737194 [Mycena olivaceomarginata]
MTRHPGGVAAHLLSPRRPRPRIIRIPPRSISKSPGSSQSNPPRVPHVPHGPPKCVPHRVPHAVPIADLNPLCASCPPEPRRDPDAVPNAGFNRSHAPPAAIVHLRHIPSPEPTFESNPPHVPRVPCESVAHLPSSAAPIANLNRPRAPHLPVEPPLRISTPDHPTSNSNPPHVAVAATVRPRTVDPNVDLNPPHASYPSAVLQRPISGLDRSIESSLPHFPPVERLPSPPIYLPIRIPQPDSKPIADPPEDDSSPHVTLSIFEILFISPSVRTELRELIDALDRGKVGYEWPSTPALRKVFYRILDKIVDSLSSSH